MLRTLSGTARSISPAGRARLHKPSCFQDISAFREELKDTRRKEGMTFGLAMDHVSKFGRKCVRRKVIVQVLREWSFANASSRISSQADCVSNSRLQFFRS